MALNSWSRRVSLDWGQEWFQLGPISHIASAGNQDTQTGASLESLGGTADWLAGASLRKYLYGMSKVMFTGPMDS